MRFVAEFQIRISAEFTKRGISDQPANHNPARSPRHPLLSQHWLGLRVSRPVLRHRWEVASYIMGSCSLAGMIDSSN